MPQPNYQFAKRQRELEKKRKKAEKLTKKESSAHLRPEDSAQAVEPPVAPEPLK